MQLLFPFMPTALCVCVCKCYMMGLQIRLVPYVDDFPLVSELQVAQEAGLGQVPQLDHVVHTLH